MNFIENYFSNRLFLKRIEKIGRRSNFGHCYSKRKSTYSLLPNFSRVKELGKVLKINPNKILKELCVKKRKRVFSKFVDGWFEFLSTNDVIIPYEISKLLAMNLRLKTVLAMHVPRLSTPTLTNQIPVIVLLGHYNHGKTTLLDTIGGTHMVQTEVHGITQTVRTRRVQLPCTNDESLSVTVVDTPGQDIFFRMRNYGSAVADSVLILVALDEGVCNQTKECIGLVQSLGLPVVVALNKLDHPTVVSQPDKIHLLEQELRSYEGLEKAAMVPISAKNGVNIAILGTAVRDTLQASKSADRLAEQERSGTDVDLVADKDVSAGRVQCPVSVSATGVVLDVGCSKKDGRTIHVLVKRGQLHVGHYFSAGGWAGSVRAIIDENNRRIESTAGGTGVLLQLSVMYSADPTPAGDEIWFYDRKNKESAMKMAEQKQMEITLASRKMSTEDVAHLRLEELLTAKNQASVPEEDDENVDEEDEDTIVRRGGGGGEIDSDGGDKAVLVPDNTNVTVKDEVEVDDEDEDEEEARSSGGQPKTYVLKTSSETVLSTILDTLSEANTFVSEDGSTIVATEAGQRMVSEVVSFGVGDVTAKDVLIAAAAGAPILMYGVSIERSSKKEAQVKGIRLLQFDKIQDIIDILIIGPKLPLKK